MDEKPSKLRVFFEKHREIIMYCIFGGLTTAVSWLVYSLCELAFRGSVATYIFTISSLVEEVETEVFRGDLELAILFANIISWVIAVLFAFVTNKIWVFNSRSWRPKLVGKEALTFIGGRAVTGIIEIIAVPLLVSFGLNQTLFGSTLPAKILVSVVIMVLNYIISKFVAFKDGGNAEEDWK